MSQQLQPYVPVLVDYKRKKQKLRFLIDKTTVQTVGAIMKKLGVRADPRSWGLFRLSRQAWLKDNVKLRDMDLQILETLVLCPRKDLLGAKIKQLGLGAEMRPDETRIVRIETTLGTHKVLKYDFNTTPDQLLEQIVKKDPIPDIQNYMLWFDELHTYLQHDQPLSVYQIPHQGELKMRKGRARVTCEIRNPHVIASFNVCFPVLMSVPDAIEYFYSQVDPKGAAMIKTDKDRAKLVRTFGLYIASPENEHGLVMTPDRTMESYKLHPDDVVVFKRRPKDAGELLLGSSEKLRSEAATFVKIVDVQSTAQATFKFPATVTVQQATSKASKKFDMFGPYGLRIPKGEVVKKPMFLEPTRRLSAYNLKNMSVLEFAECPGARITTPQDDIGDADTTRELEFDEEGARETEAKRATMRPPTGSASSTMSFGTMSLPPPPTVGFSPAGRSATLPPPVRARGPPSSSSAMSMSMSSPPAYLPVPAQAMPPSDLDVLEDLLGDVPGIDLSQMEDTMTENSQFRAPSRAAAPPAPTRMPSRGSVPVLPPPPSNSSSSTMSRAPPPITAPPPAVRGGTMSFSVGAGTTTVTGKPGGFSFTLPGAAPAPTSLPPPPREPTQKFQPANDFQPVQEEFTPLDTAPDTTDYGGDIGGTDEWGAIDDMLDFDL